MHNVALFPNMVMNALAFMGWDASGVRGEINGWAGWLSACG